MNKKTENNLDSGWTRKGFRVSGCIAAFVACLATSAFADYKTIELANGTNQVNITGAYLPVAIEVKSTVSNKTVSVDRASDVDLLRKCYDITTNETRWTEYQITTNDYFTVTNRNAMLVREAISYGDEESSELVYDNDEWIILKGAQGNTICKGDGLYAMCGSGAGLYWGNSATNRNRALSEPMYESEYYYSYRSIAYGNGKYIANGRIISGNYILAMSTDGKNWTEGSTYPGTGNYSERIKFVNDRFFFFAVNSMLMSTDGTNWTTSVSNAVSALTYVGGKYAIISDNSVQMSSDATNWTECETGSGDTVNYICAVKEWNAFLIGKSQTYNSNKYMYLLKPDGTGAAYSGAINYSQWFENPNGFVYSIHSDGYLNSFGPFGQYQFSHYSGSVGSDETWRYVKDVYTTWTLTYQPNGWPGIAPGKYWKLGMPGAGYSDLQDQRPSQVVFTPTLPSLSATAKLTYSRVTNAIEHIDYQYVTNRVYNVIDHSVTKVENIVDAQCVEGIRSQAITNRVFVINGDKIVVDGIVVDEGESTKATLICE